MDSEVVIRSLFVILALLALSGVTAAMPPDVFFMHTYAERGGFSGIVFDDTLNPPEHVVLFGSAVEGGFQFYTIRAGTDGGQEWMRLYGNLDRGKTMLRSSTGLLFQLGYTTENPTVDMRLMRLSSSGQQTGNYAFSGNTTDDYGRALIEHPNGWLCVTGQSIPDGSASGDVRLIRISTQGQISWSRLLTAGASGEALTMSGDSAFFVFATSDSADSVFGSDLIVFHTDSAGLLQSSRRFEIPGEQICRDAVRFSDSLTIIVGATRPYQAGARYWDIVVAATNDSMDSLWTRTYGIPLNDMPLSATATIDRDSGIVIAGWRDEGTTTVHRGMVMKISRLGDSLWTHNVPDEIASEYYDILQDSLFRYHIAGRTLLPMEHGLYLVTEPDPNSPGPHPPRQFSLLAPQAHDTIRLDTAFFSWQTAVDPDSGDTVRYFLRISGDTLFADSSSIEFGPLSDTTYAWAIDRDDVHLNWRVIARDPGGLERICRERYRDFHLATPDSTSPFSLLFPDSGEMLPTTYSQFRWQRALDPDANDTVFYAIRFETADTGMTVTGLRDTFMTMSFSGNPVIQRGDTVTWWVTATSRNPVMSRESRERWTFVSWISDADEPAAIPLEFALFPPYPNPFNSTTTLRFTLDRLDDIRLDVFDILGRRVATLATGVHTPGAYTIPWNGTRDNTSPASGVYFARLTAGERQRTTKLLMIR